MKRLKKMIVLSVMMMTVLSMSVVVAPSASAASAGDLIKMDGLSSVYYLGADGKRYVFPNESTYFSWYNDFSSVVTIAQSELESYPLGKNVTVRPGTKLIKITTNPNVYAVTPGGKLLLIPSEEVASALYGEAWASRVVDIADSFFTNYDIAAGEASATMLPAGSLAKFGGSDVYYIDADGMARLVVDEAAFSANRFSFDNVIDSSLDMPTAGADVTVSEDDLSDTAQGAGGQAGAGTGVSAAVSSDTAVSTSLIVGQTNAKLASFNLSAANDGPVTINTLRVKRIGVSSDATLNEVYLYEGATRLTENASVSPGMVNFNNLDFTIPAGQTRTLTVVAKLAGVAGETVGVSILAASDIVSNGASVSGAFPLTGNTHGLLAATLATVSFGIPTPSSTGPVDAGETDFSVWKSVTTIGNRKVNLESIRFRQIGSIATADLTDLRFFVNGVQAGDAQELSSDNYLTFTFPTPIVLDAGSRTLEVRANVVGGSNQNFSFSVRYAADILVKDSEYGVYVAPSGIPASSASQTVNTGSLTITKATDAPSGDIVKDASNAVLGKYEFKAYGESIKVEYLTVDFAAALTTGTLGKIRNGAVYANGVQVGSTADLIPTTGTTFSLGSSLVVVPGTPVMVEVRGDVYDNDGSNTIAAGDTITVSLDLYTNGGQRQSSLGFINVPSADTASNALTVKTGSVVLSKYSAYGNQAVVVPQSAYKLGEYILTSGSTEDITLNTLTLDFTTGTAVISEVTDVYVVYGGKTTSVKATVSASNNWSIFEVLPAGDSMSVSVYGNLAASMSTSDTVDTAVTILGTADQSATSVTSGSVAGQQMTVATASMTVAKDGSSAVPALVKGGTTIDTAAYKWSATNDEYTISELVFSFSGANAASAIASVQVKDGLTVLRTAPVSGASSTITGLDVKVPANGSKTLTVSIVTGTVGTGYGVSGADIQTDLYTFKSAPKSTGTQSTSLPANMITADPIYAYKAVPTIANQTLPTSVLTPGGTNTLAKFSVAGDGNISWKKMIFTVATSTNIGAISNVKLYDANTNTEILGTATVGATTIIFVTTSEQAVSGAKTYTLKATVSGGSIAANDYVSTSIARPLSSVITDTYANAAATSASFVWSDESANGHSVTTSDWHNDYLVKQLPTDSQVITK